MVAMAQSLLQSIANMASESGCNISHKEDAWRGPRGQEEFCKGGKNTERARASEHCTF